MCNGSSVLFLKQTAHSHGNRGSTQRLVDPLLQSRSPSGATLLRDVRHSNTVTATHLPSVLNIRDPCLIAVYSLTTLAGHSTSTISPIYYLVRIYDEI